MQHFSGFEKFGGPITFPFGGEGSYPIVLFRIPPSVRFVILENKEHVLKGSDGHYHVRVVGGFESGESVGCAGGFEWVDVGWVVLGIPQR